MRISVILLMVQLQLSSSPIFNILFDVNLFSNINQRDIFILHYSKKLKEHFDIIIFIERYPLKRCQGCVKLIASKVNCFLNINDLSEVQ